MDHKGEMMLSFLLDIVIFVWGLPQNLIGLVVYLVCCFFKKDAKYYSYPSQCLKEFYVSSLVVVVGNGWGAISLGRFIFMGEDKIDETHLDSCGGIVYPNLTVKHEYGHSLQSLIFGPLYLLVIGIPSILRACICHLRKSTAGYYEFYTEALADKLGGVRRDV